MIKIDLHSHSNYSDGLSSVKEIEEHCEEKGIGVVLTDHNEVRGSIKLCGSGKIPSIPGIEVGTQEGLEYLIYFKKAEDLEDFYVKEVEPFLMKRFMVRSRINQKRILEVCGGNEDIFVSLAHPFAFGRKSIDFWRHSNHDILYVKKNIHAVEKYNGGVPMSVNRRAGTLVRAWAKKITMGSDAHHKRHVGTVSVSLNCPEKAHREELYDALFNNHFMGENVEGKTKVAEVLPVIVWNHTKYFISGHRTKSKMAQTGRT